MAKRKRGRGRKRERERLLVRRCIPLQLLMLPDNNAAALHAPDH
jgi:hypothetical protein